MTFVLPQFEQLMPNIHIPKAARTRSACVFDKPFPFATGSAVPSEFDRLVITSIISLSAVRGSSATGRLIAFLSISAISFIGRSSCDRLGRGSLFVAFDELATEPSKDVIRNAGGVANIGILRKSTWLESLIGELLDQALERHSVLQSERRQSGYRVHQAANGTPLFRHLNE